MPQLTGEETGYRDSNGGPRAPDKVVAEPLLTPLQPERETKIQETLHRAKRP